MPKTPLKRFILVLVVFFTFWQMVIMLLPVTSYLPNQVFIYVLNLTYITVVLLSFFFFLYIFVQHHHYDKSSFCRSEKEFPVGRQLKFNISIASFGGILGFLLILYDRVVVRGIDYSAGLRAARYEWLRESTGGSIFSVVGNLIIPFCYVAIFYLIVYKHSLTRGQRFFLTSSALCGVVGHAILNGGRSNVLIAIFIVLIILIFNVKKSTYDINVKKTKNRFGVYFILVIVATFIIGLTLQSAQLANISMVELLRLGISSLYGQATENFEYIDNDIVAMVVYMMSYIFHGSWTAEAVYSLADKPGSYLLYPISVIGSSLGIVTRPIELGFFSESGAFLSLPGAMYYDFGFTGVIILSLILGWASAAAVYYLSYKRVTLIGFGIALYPIVILLMSPILPAYGLIYFNFVVYAFIINGVINVLFFGKRLHWI
ncbi:O-antigen polymerase [Aeromonas caviae]